MNRDYFRQWLLLMATILLAVIVFFVGRPGSAADARLEEGPLTLQPDEAEATINSCRYGTSGVASYSNFVYDMRVGWTVDFGARPGATLADIEYLPTVRIEQPRDPVTGARLNSYALVSPASMAELATMVQGNRGLVWQIGNEVDRVYWQDDIMPQVYARAYHDIYQVIKTNDPTAQVAPSALVEVTPARLQYLDIVWDEYLRVYKRPMPVDVWNMHIYILPEIQYARNPDGTVKLDGSGNPVLEGSRAGIALGTDRALAIRFSEGDPAMCARADVYCYAEHDDINIFMQQVYAMRQWMKAHGQQHKPLILTEFGILYPFREDSDPPYDPETCPACYTLQDEYGNAFTRQRVTNFMNATLNFMESTTDPNLGYPEDNHRLVQQWNWYAVYDGNPAFGSNLVEDDGSALTMMGQTYKARNAAHGFGVNLRVSETPAVAVRSAGGTATAGLTVTFHNNGNTRTQAPVKVAFYSNAAMTALIGEIEIPAGVMGCATRPYTASVTWPGLTPGLHRYWVKVDNANSILETSESDNTGTGFVLVDPLQGLLPLIAR